LGVTAHYREVGELTPNRAPNAHQTRTKPLSLVDWLGSNG
jgi:hypothetical protein